GETHHSDDHRPDVAVKERHSFGSNIGPREDESFTVADAIRRRDGAAGRSCTPPDGVRPGGRGGSAPATRPAPIRRVAHGVFGRGSLRRPSGRRTTASGTGRARRRRDPGSGASGEPAAPDSPPDAGEAPPTATSDGDRSCRGCRWDRRAAAAHPGTLACLLPDTTRTTPSSHRHGCAGDASRGRQPRRTVTAGYSLHLAEA